MNIHTMKNRGFTLIELLVVIAIIGILSSVVLVSLGNARTRARLGSAQATLSGILPAASVCADDGYDLTDNVTPAVPAAGTPVCTSDGSLAVTGLVRAGTPNWPTLPGTSWIYVTDYNADATLDNDFTLADGTGTFSFGAVDDADGSGGFTAGESLIVCTDAGCVTS